MLSSKLHSSIGNTDKLYVDDVFSAYTYTGNGSTQTINNGIDLAGKGGMVWTKKRTAQSGNYQDGHRLQDTTRGAGDFIDSSATTASSLSGGGSFLSNGLVMAGDGATTSNSHQFISWTFRKAPKFFDVVTYTGNGTNYRKISHGLGIEPGMIIIKKTNATSNWRTYHRTQLGGNLRLNTMESVGETNMTIDDVTTSDFKVTHATSVSNDSVNANGATYVAYLFAHDTSADGFIQCGEFTGMPSSIVLGWEPQYLMIKRTDSEGNWQIYDTTRNWCNGEAAGTASRLQPNLSNAEQAIGDFGEPTSTGFNVRNEGSGNYIYLAIRRPNKPPTTGTEVYNAIARTGNNTNTKLTGVGFAPDLFTSKSRNGTGTPEHYWVDKLRGSNKSFMTTSTNAEATDGWAALASFDMDGVYIPSGSHSLVNPDANYINHFFKRAPGFFDVVCYTGTGSVLTLNHSLNATPELIIFKNRSTATNWLTYHSFGVSSFLRQLLNADGGTASFSYGSGAGFNNQPTATQIGLDANAATNAGSTNCVAYLFATLPGISKVGSYTGNGSSQTINCGFSTGARFVLIKRTDSAGDWFVWDTVRGIVSANDPHLSLNTTAAEVTTNDSVDPDSTGFIVNQVAATNINVTSATYLYLAIA